MALEIFRLIGSVFVDTDEANKSLQKSDEKASNFGKTLLNGVTTAAKWAAGVATAAGTAATALSVAAVKSYADNEQLVGGVETLFKESADKVLGYADIAYKTAGLSANAYMETVTSFSASLLQSLGGDTAKAAEYADQAIIDMADNANKMGSTMESIQTAYAGFAKGQYNLLDNLKLGYGGTQAEMFRLLQDAAALNSEFAATAEFSMTSKGQLIANFSDITQAIHIVQTEMGITGTTATEGMDTISGGVALIKSRLEDFKTTIGSALAPVVQGFISSVIENLPTIQGWVEQLTPLLTNMLSGILAVIPDFVQGLVDIVVGFQEAITWGKENETVLGLVALAVGALTTAIGLYQAAETLKNIAVTAGVAAEGSATVAMGLHTVATNIATAASTAFGAVMAFITSPITLVVAGIAALIAIIYLLVDNWDVVSAAAVKCWEWIKETWNKVATWFDANVIKPVVNSFSKLWSKLTGAASDAWEAIKKVFSNWGTFFSGLWDKIKTTFSKIGTNIANAISSSVKSGINGVISAIENTINTGVNLINGAISLINKIPGVSVGKISRLALPRLARGGVVDEPTFAQIGEDGAEAVVPLERNTGWIDRLSEKVAQSIVVQYGQGNNNVSLDKVLDKMDDLLDALRANQTVTLNKREFARIVKEVG